MINERTPLEELFWLTLRGVQEAYGITQDSLRRTYLRPAIEAMSRAQVRMVHMHVVGPPEYERDMRTTIDSVIGDLSGMDESDYYSPAFQAHYGDAIYRLDILITRASSCDFHRFSRVPIS